MTAPDDARTEARAGLLLDALGIGSEPIRPPHDVVVVPTALDEPLRWRCCKCDRVWVLDPASGRDGLADPETGSASACPVVGPPRMVVGTAAAEIRGADVPACRHGVPEGEPCGDCARESAEDAVAWTSHDEHRADHRGAASPGPRALDREADADHVRRRDRMREQADDEPRAGDDARDGDGGR